MTKANEVSGGSANAGDSNWAGAVLRLLFDAMLENWDAARESRSVEGVHDLRVATRRLRSALRSLSFLLAKKPLKQLKTDLRKIADALGAARDQDVAIIALEKLRNETSVENIRAGISELIEERETARRRAQASLLKALSPKELEDLRKLFEEAIDRASRTKRPARVVNLDQAGREVVGKSLDEFCELSGNIYKPSSDKALHDLRIAAKRLRYAIELYKDCWRESIEPFAESMAEMQDHLGKIHDSNVWLESLGKNLLGSQQVNPAHAWLLSEFVEKRTKNYRAALALYGAWKDTGFVQRLRSTVSSPASRTSGPAIT